MDRGVAAKSLRFAGLGGRTAGRRAVAGWDEDAVTLAAEAARQLAVPDKLIFASTSAPFHERLQATLVAAALDLPETTRTGDVSGARRCGVSALLDALLGTGNGTIAAGEKRLTRPGSAAHLAWGDGGAAISVGDSGSARLIGFASRTHDLIDIYASRDVETPYLAEERFVRDTAGALIAETVAAACAAAGVSPGSIAHAAVHEPLAGMWRDIAARVGTKAENHAAALDASAGDLGAAHAPYALALALAAAQPGDLVLLAGFGSGCDALVFEVTGETPGAASAAAALAFGLALTDYVRFLALTRAIDLDFGVRAEFEQKAQAAVIERHGRDAMAFIGGSDTAGNVQFPKSRIPVRPGAQGIEPLEDVRLADVPGTLVSVTADRLNYTPDPPFWFGLVQFEGGARVLMELTDAVPAGFSVGDRLAMRLRIKSHDRTRGMRTYFWKAAPALRPALED
ncbi:MULTISPECIES: 3-oxoacyl-[acyl-carrier-protein] synthase III C-terminal domain-containing protein [unclassified Sphingomonas]|uniref:3-oxoacyl-[acyl-carrier-protein] synthase III C-terminal domain-containing protein n=1 Tax=unclassified Sphingomonas TaxID=196159 RepID=UPI0018D243BB|nr:MULTISPECIES: 3-oxoacyl-[acyl-carrier-protein] synthase III C-terminal domain-containing protein [unclassified Sphingomonas]